MFDWGGTLARVAGELDTRRDCAAAGLAFLRGAGLKAPAGAEASLAKCFLAALGERQASPDLREFDSRSFLREWAADAGLAVSPDGMLDRWVAAFWRPWVGCLELIGDAPAALRRLQRRGLTVGLVSNTATPPSVCRAELTRLGLADLLAFTVFSSEVGYRKPHPRPFEKALSLAGDLAPGLRPAEVLYVGDTPVADVAGPAALGLKTALVRGGAWDGDEGTLDVRPDVILESVHELAEEYTADGPEPRNTAGRAGN